jgi:hypothetical protein
MTDFNNTPDDYNTGSGGGTVRETGIFVGVVKGNKDVQRMGRLQVWIPELGGNPNDEASWFIVSYASPFAGATNPDLNKKDGKKMADTQTSYGWWAVPPDLENQVLVCFANGDTSRGFWFACLYQQFMNHMVPGVAIDYSTDPDFDKDNLPPVCEYNKKDASQDVWDPKRPIFEPLSNALRAQGLYTDPERGPATTSARRESPSKVFGFSSPRSHNIHIDEGDENCNEFIRIRSRNGVQILLHDSTGYIYMISREGNSWMEISDEGINMYSKKSISIRSEQNVNVHSNQSIIQHGAGAVHTRAGNTTNGSTGAHTTVTQGDHHTESTQGNVNTQTPSGRLQENSDGGAVGLTPGSSSGSGTSASQGSTGSAGGTGGGSTPGSGG